VFIRLRTQVEELRPLKERQAALEQDLNELTTKRWNLLTAWEDAKNGGVPPPRPAANRVSKKLSGRVRVRVAHAGDRQPLLALLKRRVGSRLSETAEVLAGKAKLSLTELADAWRGGRAVLEKKFRLPGAQAERLVQAGSEGRHGDGGAGFAAADDD